MGILQRGADALTSVTSGEYMFAGLDDTWGSRNRFALPIFTAPGDPGGGGGEYDAGPGMLSRSRSKEPTAPGSKLGSSSAPPHSRPWGSRTMEIASYARQHGVSLYRQTAEESGGAYRPPGRDSSGGPRLAR